jgi:hypothetical protein
MRGCYRTTLTHLRWIGVELNPLISRGMLAEASTSTLPIDMLAGDMIRQALTSAYTALSIDTNDPRSTAESLFGRIAFTAG